MSNINIDRHKLLLSTYRINMLPLPLPFCNMKQLTNEKGVHELLRILISLRNWKDNGEYLQKKERSEKGNWIVVFEKCKKYLQYVSVVRRSMVSCFNFEFFLPILELQTLICNFENDISNTEKGSLMAWFLFHL